MINPTAKLHTSGVIKSRRVEVVWLLRATKLTKDSGRRKDQMKNLNIEQATLNSVKKKAKIWKSGWRCIFMYMLLSCRQLLRDKFLAAGRCSCPFPHMKGQQSQYVYMHLCVRHERGKQQQASRGNIPSLINHCYMKHAFNTTQQRSCAEAGGPFISILPVLSPVKFIRKKLHFKTINYYIS